MQNHRNIPPISLKILDIQQSFSNFDYVDSNYQGSPTIRRLFSLSRTLGGKTLVVEDIPAAGIISSENEEILKLRPKYKMQSLQRLSFWSVSFSSQKELETKTSTHLIGYAILKHDYIQLEKINRWHVFESVFSKYPHRHNCVPSTKIFQLRIGDKSFSKEGALYCQQNGINKACAQVALKSICSLHVSDLELSFERINSLASNAGIPFNSGEGLESSHIRSVLQGLGIKYTDFDYTVASKKAKEEIPYQKFLYAGIESGAGSLLGFQLTGPKARGRHIIPFYGHTFNQDTWVSKADQAYFKVGEQTQYIPSEVWVSSFIGHDDNFGSNFCVPKNYITSDNVKYVVELFNNNKIHYSGIIAEAIAIDYLYSILPELSHSKNKWLDRLIYYTSIQEIVLRAISMEKDKYLVNLKNSVDWNQNKENEHLIDILNKYLPPLVWVIEVSIPQLFPVNQRKLGEIVLDATKKTSKKQDAGNDFHLFLLARFPGVYLFLQQIQNNLPQFIKSPSQITTHTALFS